VSEKSRAPSELKCTLAAAIGPVGVGEEYAGGLPLHITVAPPFRVSESRLYDLVLAYYNIISPWAEYASHDDGEGIEISVAGRTDIFGSREHPVTVRRISLQSELETDDFIALREMIKETTEEICGVDSTNDWIVGEFHVSEGEHDLSVLEGHIAVDSLALFVKRDTVWRVEEVLAWRD
jgi:hypothetical protein